MVETVELRQEVKKIRVAALRAFVVCLICFGVSYWWIPSRFELPGSLMERLAFTLRLDLFVILWVIIAVGMVSRGRRRSAADIGGAAFSPPSRAIAIHVAFLQNTLEQAFLAVFVHLTLATLLRGDELSFIPAAVFLFSLGRITFLLGYPKGARARAFGMVTTVLPTIFGFLAALVLMLIDSTR
jgi:uncharacterized membrane protein